VKNLTLKKFETQCWSCVNPHTFTASTYTYTKNTVEELKAASWGYNRRDHVWVCPICRVLEDPELKPLFIKKVSQIKVKGQQTLPRPRRISIAVNLLKSQPGASNG